MEPRATGVRPGVPEPQGSASSYYFLTPHGSCFFSPRIPKEAGTTAITGGYAVPQGYGGDRHRANPVITALHSSSSSQWEHLCVQNEVFTHEGVNCL